MRKLGILALLALAACAQPVPVLSIEDGGSDFDRMPLPRGVLVADPKTGETVFLNDGTGLFF